MHDLLTIVLGILALSVTVMGGFVKFLYGRISEVEKAQLQINGEIRDEMQRFIGELRQAMNIQASDHRLAQHNLWTELRRIADKNSEEHTRATEKIGQLATRDEMTKALEATENRLMIALRKDVSQR